MPGFAAFHVGIQTEEAPTEDIVGPPLTDVPKRSKDYVDGMSE